MFDYEVLCTQALPELEGGWDSTAWPSPKTHAQVIIRAAVGDEAAGRLEEIRAYWRGEGMPADALSALVDQEIVAIVTLNCRPKAAEFAEGYGDAIARSARGLLLEVDSMEILVDARADEPLDGPGVQAALEAVDGRLLEAQRQQREGAQKAWEKLAEEDPEAVRQANDWSDVAPESG